MFAFLDGFANFKTPTDVPFSLPCPSATAPSAEEPSATPGLDVLFHYFRMSDLAKFLFASLVNSFAYGSPHRS